jgi:glycosyltransferase involved in cell wall biosynthesis
LIDNRDSNTSIGQKRNSLLALSKKDYVAFIDDDDLVSEDYISILLNSIQEFPDCVSLNGIITTDGTDEHKFIHSLKYKMYSENKDLKEYYRPPNHLNCIKSSIAKQVSFIHKNYGEDTDWALELMSKNILKTEKTISQVIYFYQYIKNK